MEMRMGSPILAANRIPSKAGSIRPSAVAVSATTVPVAVTHGSQVEFQKSPGMASQPRLPKPIERFP